MTIKDVEQNLVGLVKNIVIILLIEGIILASLLLMGVRG